MLAGASSCLGLAEEVLLFFEAVLVLGGSRGSIGLSDLGINEEFLVLFVYIPVR